MEPSRAGEAVGATYPISSCISCTKQLCFARNVATGLSICRNIRTLFNFAPPATEEEIRASALQFVRKLSGFSVPSKTNEAVFQRAVDEVTDAARRLLVSLDTTAPPRDRVIEAAKAKERSRQRFSK